MQKLRNSIPFLNRISFVLFLMNIQDLFIDRAAEPPGIRFTGPAVDFCFSNQQEVGAAPRSRKMRRKFRRKKKKKIKREKKSTKELIVLVFKMILILLLLLGILLINVHGFDSGYNKFHNFGLGTDRRTSLYIRELIQKHQEGGRFKGVK